MRKRFFLNCLLMLTLVLVMSTSAFAISESDVESAVSASGKEAVSGNVLVWFLCAIAFLKVSQKIDSFLSSLGLNVGHTGGSMLSEAMIAMRAINTATSAVGSALGSRSRHGSAPASGKSGSGSAAAAGFFSGGLVGMASRKIASDAVRTATAEKNIVQPQQAEATVSRTHASSDTHSGSQSASERRRQNTSQLDQNQQTVSSRAVKSEQQERSQQALHESQHSVDASQLHQDTQSAQEQQFHAALHTEDQQASHLAFQSEQGEFVGSVVQSDEFDASSEEARTEQSQVMQSALQQEQIGATQREVQSEESRHAQHDTDTDGDGKCDTCGAAVSLTVTWDADSNGGTINGKASFSETVKPNSVPAAPSASPVKTGHTFKNWYTEKTGGKLYNTVTSITTSQTFYAQFTANTYTVTWNLGDGRSETTEQTYGEKLLLPKDPERKNAEFLGWFTEKDGGTEVTTNTVFEETAATMYYAHWEVTELFSVTVPATLPLVVDEAGKVYVASASIVNNSTGDVKVSSVSVTSKNGWEFVPYSTNMAKAKVDAKQVGFKINSSETSKTGDSEVFTLAAPWTVKEANALSINYDAVVSAVSQPVTGQEIMSVVFVLEWA